MGNSIKIKDWYISNFIEFEEFEKSLTVERKSQFIKKGKKLF
jgi:hypothetical protein